MADSSLNFVASDLRCFFWLNCHAKAAKLNGFAGNDFCDYLTSIALVAVALLSE